MTTPTNKTYCVHVYERPHTYKNVIARSPAEAENHIIAREWQGDYENIEKIEVRLQCVCGYDNELDSKVCDECGQNL